MRIIPGKTKVRLELFKGISIWDMVVGLVGVVIIVLTFASSLPYSWIFAIIEGLITALLLARLDKEPNYVFILNMLRHLGYPRRYKKLYSDKELVDIAKKGFNEVAIEQVFNAKKGNKEAAEPEPQPEEEALEASEEAVEAEATDEVEATEDVEASEGAEETEQAEHAEETAAVEATEENDGFDEDEDHVETKTERKLRKKAEKAEYKADSKLLKSKALTKEEEDAIWLKRAQQAENKKKAKKKAKEDKAKVFDIEDITSFTDIKDGYISYAGRYYGVAIEVPAVAFRFFSQFRRDTAIENGVGSILRACNADYAANIVKIERPITYEHYIKIEYQKLDNLRATFENGMITEEELQTRIDVVYERINELLNYESNEKVILPFYYIVLFDSDKIQLNTLAKNAIDSLQQCEIDAHRLNDAELAVFLKYTNALDFDETEIEKVNPEDYAKWAMANSVKVKHRYVLVNKMITHNMRVVNFPTTVDDAWLASVMTIPSTKVIVKATPMDRGKSITAIDRSLSELRSSYMSARSDSTKIEIGTHIETLQSLLVTLQSDNESLLSVNIYVSAYDPQGTVDDPKVENFEYTTYRTPMTNMKKAVRRVWQEAGFRLNNMEFNQTRAFIGSQVSGYDPMIDDGRGMPSNTIAATFPWIFSYVMDRDGFKLGESDGVPVFLDFFRRDSERVNSNMVIVGKSGSGKSFATKSLLTNLAADDSKIFILDPENEYSDLAKNMHGKFINVANASSGRLNPFHIITSLDDDETGEDGANQGDSYSMHMQFLEGFFQQILPDCDKDSLEYLNSLVDRMYGNRHITTETDLSLLKPEDYPIFDDLYDEILKEFQRTDNEYIRTMLRTLMNYISKFSTGGRNATIWNGPSTITTEENFTVFNFQSLLSNRNGTVANAQMLLVLKYIDNEIIKNREYNKRYGLNRKVIVVIDEAHVFIDTKYPVALDFMFQLAKRIRKYNGMQIVITQNIKDFVGSEEIARKSTAIINACQYSFIFPLAPNDMQDLCTLYEKAGGINEREQEEIVQAPRGQAFTILGPSTRTTFKITVPPDVRKIYKPNYVSPYFTGPDGDKNWADYVKDSNEKREANLAEFKAKKEAEEAERQNNRQIKEVQFSEITEEELLALDIGYKEPTYDATEKTPIKQNRPIIDIDNMSDADLDALIGSEEKEITLEAPVVEPVQVQAQAAPQIIVQAPPQSQKTEELLTELLHKLSLESISEEIKHVVKQEVGNATMGMVQTSEPAPAESDDLDTSGFFSLDDFEATTASESDSSSDAFGGLDDLFSVDETSSEAEEDAETVALGNIFDFAAQDEIESTSESSSGDDEFGFNIMDLLQEEAAKLDSISPIDEMVTYGEMVCDISLEELVAYIIRPHE